MNTTKAQKHLSKDPVLQKIIKQHPPFSWSKTGDIYIDLVESIISQQLSLASAASIFTRFKDLFKGKITPETTLKFKSNQLKSVGLSGSKVQYIQNVARSHIAGDILHDKLEKLSDSEVIVRLTNIKGIGPWSANIILMFSLGRQDIFPVGDLGIRKAISKLYNLDREDHQSMIEISKKWSPYRTLASRYLWKSLT